MSHQSLQLEVSQVQEARDRCGCEGTRFGLAQRLLRMHGKSSHIPLLLRSMTDSTIGVQWRLQRWQVFLTWRVSGSCVCQVRREEAEGVMSQHLRSGSWLTSLLGLPACLKRSSVAFQKRQEKHNSAMCFPSVSRWTVYFPLLG